jgi:4-pyridoxolactonase
MVHLANRRPLLFVGDACYSQLNLDMNALPASNHDHAEAILSLNRLCELAAQHDAEIIFPHDPENWPSYKRAPAFYA